MKRRILKPLVLGLSTFVGAALAHSVLAADANVYSVNFIFTNATPICTVYGVPEADMSDVTVDVLDSSVSTDGAGKITGFAELQLTTADGSATVIANVSGSMGMKGNYPVVKMALKGAGATTSGNNSGKANLNVKFTGAPVYYSSSGEYLVQGSVDGKFSTGLQGVKNTSIKNVDAYISGAEGLTQIQSCILDLVSVNNSLTIGGCTRTTGGTFYTHPEWFGTGTANNNGNFSLTLNGTDAGDTPMAGSKLTLKGNAADNPISPGDMIFTTLSASGKIMGQKVSSTGASGGLQKY